MSAVKDGEGKKLVVAEKNIESSALKNIVKDYPTTLGEGFTVEVNLRFNNFFKEIFNSYCSAK